MPKGAVTVTVKDGWVTLEGVVDWQYQKDMIRKAVEHLTCSSVFERHWSRLPQRPQRYR